MSVKHSLPRVKMEGHAITELAAIPVPVPTSIRGINAKSKNFARQSLSEQKIMEMKFPGDLDHALEARNQIIIPKATLVVSLPATTY